MQQRAGLFSALFALLLVHPAAAQQSPRGSDAAVREIMQTALDEALQDQVKHLFETWMKDPTGQPGRAANGIRKAVAAYRHAIRAIETQKLSTR